jgi:hypothetical protein
MSIELVEEVPQDFVEEIPSTQPRGDSSVSLAQLDPTTANQVQSIKKLAQHSLGKGPTVKPEPLKANHAVSKAEPQIDKTRQVAAASGALASLSNPHSLRSLFDLAASDASEDKTHKVDKIDPVPPSSSPLHDPTRSLFDLVASETTPEKKDTPFPNLALEALNLGLKMEQFQSEEKIQKYDAEGRRHKQNIDTLLKLGSHLQKFSSENESHDLTDAMKALLSTLREQKIDLFPDLEIPSVISREELGSLKSLLSSRIDEQKMHVQDLFSTKISIAIQFMNTTQDMMKEIIRKDERQKSTAVRGQQRQ